jgi:hypothetical protein
MQKGSDMRRYLSMGLVLFAGLGPELSFATLGNEGAHGGAGIYCYSSPLNKFNGFYLLDFVIMRGGNASNSWPYPCEFALMTDRRQILNYIETRMRKKLPRLAADLHEFRRYTFLDNPSAPVRWIPKSTLPRIWDQGLGKRPWQSQEEVNFPSLGLPQNCMFDDIVQVAAKYYDGDKTAIAYVPELVSRLNNSGPLQLSYLIIHEWLRSYTNDAEVIRRANRLLHSTALDELSPEQLRELLREIGLF